jgi:hypothetical protein
MIRIYTKVIRLITCSHSDYKFRSKGVHFLIFGSLSISNED